MANELNRQARAADQRMRNFIVFGTISLIAGCVLGWHNVSALFAWFLNLIGLGLITVGAGCCAGGLNGFMLSDKGRISLSRFQIACWTVFILSAYLTAVVINASVGAADMTGIVVPEELWVLLGISMTTTVGSSLILTNQENKAKDPILVDRATDTKPKPENAEAEGAADEGDGDIAAKESAWELAAEARFSDLWTTEFKTDLPTDDADRSQPKLVDISRLQLLYFTIFLLLAYGFYLSRMFVDAQANDWTPIETLPPLSASMVTLLAISHAGYLGRKALPPKQKAPDGDNDQNEQGGQQ